MFMPGPIPDSKDAPEENKPWLTDMLNDLGDGVASLLKYYFQKLICCYTLSIFVLVMPKSKASTVGAAMRRTQAVDQV